MSWYDEIREISREINRKRVERENKLNELLCMIPPPQVLEELADSIDNDGTTYAADLRRLAAALSDSR